MKTTTLLSFLVLTAAIVGMTSCNKPQPKVSFSSQIRPLLEARCVNCHNAGALFGDLNLENRELAFKPRSKGAVITPGSPDKSSFYLVLTLPEGDRKAMPPTGHRISDEETALIKLWIHQGAEWPAGPEGVVTPSVSAHDNKGV